VEYIGLYEDELGWSYMDNVFATDREKESERREKTAEKLQTAIHWPPTHPPINGTRATIRRVCLLYGSNYMTSCDIFVDL